MVTTYTTCTADDIPAGLRWETPAREQGQIVQTSHSLPCGDEGAPYRRTIDLSEEPPRRCDYARREDVGPAQWAALDRQSRGLALFGARRDAERFSRSCHRGSDAVLQVIEGRILDARGWTLTRAEAVASLCRRTRMRSSP